MSEHQFKNVEEIFAKKARIRKLNAKLPLAEKLQVIVRLQKEAYVLAKSSGRKPQSKPWHSNAE